MYEVTIQNADSFDENDSKYKCCCCCCCCGVHATIALRILLIFQYLSAALLLTVFATSLFSEPKEETPWPLMILFGILLIQSAFCQSALWKENKNQLIPPLIIQILFLLLWVFILLYAFYVIVMALGGYIPEFFGIIVYQMEGKDRAANAALLWKIFVFFSLIAIITNVWGLCIMRRCYRYLKDKATSHQVVYGRA